MKTKKALSLILAMCILMLLSVPSLAACDVKEKKLTFNENGKFRIMMITDFQDRDIAKADSFIFINRILDTEKPDLVVLGGDQLASSFPLATKFRLKNALKNVLKPMNDRKIPFLFAFGNHDHDWDDIFSSEEQAEAYLSYKYCFATKDGNDPGTYNKLVYSSDGSKPILNVYMMDTNNHNYENGGSYDGVHPDQVEWYKNKSDELKALNNGEVIPSILFQHIPVKEIFNVLKIVPEGTPNSYMLKSSGLDNYYTIDADKMICPDYYLGEAPNSEIITRTTGQYEAWLEKGDIKYGAYFGHDHVNDFVGKTDDGIVLGYTSGFGTRSYNIGAERSVKIFDFDENNMDSCNISRVKYCDLEGNSNDSFRTFFTEVKYFFIYSFNNFVNLFKS